MKHIDKVFRDKLYNQKAPVPDGMWEKIAPALEEKSGRSILWFWFAGILTLLIGGISYLLLSNYLDTNSSGYPLVTENPTQEAQPSTPISQALITEELTIAESDLQLESKNTQEIKTITDSPKPKRNNSTQQQSSTKTTVKQVIESNNLGKTKPNSASASILDTNTDNLYGKPANLVITKSYVSDKGSIIEKSNLSNDSAKSEPSYNVFINSEGLNAGALLRIVEPLENIPLPAFSQNLKKKIIL